MTIRDEVARAIGGGRGLYDYAGADAACAVFAAKLREAHRTCFYLRGLATGTTSDCGTCRLLASLQSDTTEGDGG